MSKTAFLFPGQGSQSVGMGQSLITQYPIAKEIFEQVDTALEEKLSTTILKGPDDDLNLTENTQPALMAVSIAALKALESEGIKMSQSANICAGHSLGEYSAYCAADSMSLADTAKLLRIRGQAMQKAVPVGEGKMAAIIGLDMEAVNTVVKESADSKGGICVVANDNCNGQVVISGHAPTIEVAIEQAQAKGAKRALPLPVSAPFHCPLMQPAADAMAGALEETDIKMPTIPVLSNVTLNSAQSVDEIRTTLVQQVTSQVRWRETLDKMIADGVTTFIEIGAGKVLSGLVKRTSRDVAILNIATADDVVKVAEQLTDNE